MRTYILLISILATFYFPSCKQNRSYKIDTKTEPASLRVMRFDLDLIAIDTLKVDVGVRKLYAIYPLFMPVYVREVMGENPDDTAKVIQQIAAFLKNKSFIPVNQKVREVFQNTDSIVGQVTDAYSYIHHYLPALPTPPLCFFVSGFNQSILIDEKFIGIGVDFYLGSDYPAYADMTYAYMLYNMRPASIAPDVISALLFAHYHFDGMQDRLLDNMLHRAKIMYAVAALMPQLLPNEVMGYTKFQWEWCRKNEVQIWNTLVGNKDLFSTDQMLVTKYLNDAPFTSPISQESPGRLGTWVGWQIVQNYMNAHKEVSLQHLLDENNYQKILDQSGYNPN
ncbi:MAG: hypothetical protein AUK44_05170 [Porphyromonadaceae bacterium CG2_30_38_12]|nr:MAG: hypothetical protein AUK44_05170 [Porphyromonadaceae bacterium CG2_30_38_12]